LIDGRLDVQLGQAFSTGGATDSEQLKDVTGYVDRSLYGYVGLDFFGEIHATVLKDLFELPATPLQAFLLGESKQALYLVNDLSLLVNLHLVSKDWHFWGERQTRMSFSVRNLLGTTYDYPGFQPYYRFDVPGMPRRFLLSMTQEF